MTEKQYPELPESGSGRNMTMAAFLRQPPNVKEPIYMAALDKAAIEQQRIIDADRAMRSSRIDELEQLLAEAYQVVGVLLIDTDQFNTEHGTKILDNLSQMRPVHGDVLPWESRAMRARESAAVAGPVAWRLTNTSFRKPRFEYHDTKEAAEQRQADFNRSVDEGGLHDLTPLYAALATQPQEVSPSQDAEDAAHIANLIEVVRMPNVEYVADAHNDAVKHLRARAQQEKL